MCGGWGGAVDRDAIRGMVTGEDAILQRTAGRVRVRRRRRTVGNLRGGLRRLSTTLPPATQPGRCRGRAAGGGMRSRRWSRFAPLSSPSAGRIAGRSRRDAPRRPGRVGRQIAGPCVLKSRKAGAAAGNPIAQTVCYQSFTRWRDRRGPDKKYISHPLRLRRIVVNFMPWRAVCP